MYGNYLGWSISAVIILATGTILKVVGAAGEVSSPTDFGLSANRYSIELPIDPLSLCHWMTEPGDSGPVYQEALAEYRANSKPYDRIQRLSDAPSLKKGLDLLIRAGKMRSGGIFRGNPAAVINYSVERDNLEAIKSLSRAAGILGKLHGDAGNVSDARAAYEAVFAVGAKLYAERLSFWEFDVANEPLELGSRGLAKLDDDAGESARANRYKTFSKERVDYITNNIISVRDHIWALNPHVGDMIAVIRSDADPMWRADALLALGRCKYSAGKFGDQQGALKILDEFSENPDPRLRLAAQTALNLKIEDFRRLR